MVRPSGLLAHSGRGLGLDLEVVDHAVGESRDGARQRAGGHAAVRNPPVANGVVVGEDAVAGDWLIGVDNGWSPRHGYRTVPGHGDGISWGVGSVFLQSGEFLGEVGRDAGRGSEALGVEGLDDHVVVVTVDERGKLQRGGVGSDDRILELVLVARLVVRNPVAEDWRTTICRRFPAHRRALGGHEDRAVRRVRDFRATGDDRGR